MDLAIEDMEELELKKETKSIGTNGKYFRALATPKWERPKKEEEAVCKWNFTINFVDCKNENKPNRSQLKFIRLMSVKCRLII